MERGLSGQENAKEVLEKLADPGASGWFKPLGKTYWLAVGMGVNAFQMFCNSHGVEALTERIRVSALFLL